MFVQILTKQLEDSPINKAIFAVLNTTPMKFKLIAIFFFLQLATHAQSLFINEALTLNTFSVTDEDNDYNDWIEIYNNGTSAVQLQGMALSNDSLNLMKWTFPNQVLDAKSFLLVFASGKNRKMGHYLHTNFALNAAGAKIFLSDPSGNKLDKFYTPYLTPNVSYGRKNDASTGVGYFAIPTPGKTNNSSKYYALNLETPDFSASAGFYPDTVELVISHPLSGVSIHYTLDGSEPTLASPVYTSSLKLSTRANDPNGISLIPTNPGLNFPYYTFDTSKADSRGWLPPYGNVQKVNVVRAKAFAGNAIPSETKTRTYIIDSLLNERYKFPVLSISTDKENLFSEDSGIYVYGKPRPNDPLFDGDYSYSGPEWTIPLYLEFFNEDGSLGFSRYSNGELNGNGGRHAPQKSFRFYKTGQNEVANFNYKFFDEKEISVFEKILLRNGGHRPDCFPRDNMADKICDGLNMEVPNYKMVVVFINGEYWGLQCIKERFDNAYFQHNFNIKNEDFTMLQLKGELTEGVEGDEQHYLNLIDFVSNNDLSITENYNYVNTQMDIENYITFQVSEMYIGNGDWPNNNTRFWRKKTADYEPGAAYGLDGRWRWVFYDLDGGFGGSCPNVTPTFNSIKRATNDEPLYVNYTILLRALLKNNGFKNDLLSRYADLLNSNYSSKVVSKKITAEKNLLATDILEHVNRWRYPSLATTLVARNTEVPGLTQWDNIFNNLLGFASERPVNDRRRLMEYFGLQDTLKITLDVNDKAQGEIKINTIQVNYKLPGVKTSVYPWSGTYFKGVPVNLTAIPKPGYKFLYWAGSNTSSNAKITASPLGNASYTAVFGPDPSFTYVNSILINEINATNKNIIKDPYNENDDWIELYNPSDNAVDVEGYFLSDDISNLTKYKFPKGTPETIIPPKGFLLIWADHQEGQGKLHTPFKLRASGERIELTAPDSVTIIDSLSFGNIEADNSYGRYPNGAKNLVIFSQPTPSGSNALDKIFEPKIVLHNFVLYPNPVTNTMVQFTRIADVKIYNAQGQIVKEAIAVKQLDVSDLTHGIYYLRTLEGQTAKLVKL